MRRRDQYGTHDDHQPPQRDRPSRSGMRGTYTAEPLAHGRKGPDYGNRAERAVRTSTSDQAAFQGRDYERENYGGGYGTQRETRDVPAAGRKGDWMHGARGGRPEPGWRGQEGGAGMDGLASERAFGSDADQQMSGTDHDKAYRRWRDAELSRHDEEYWEWRRRRQERHDQDYAQWKAAQGRPKRDR